MPRFNYRLYGLTLSSAIDLPELHPAAEGVMPNVTVSLGTVPASGDDGPEPRPIEGGHSIAIPGVARFAILGGNAIIVDPDPAASPGNVRLFLLGSVIGMLLHQAGLLPLHANAVEMDGRAIAVMGRSGSGKSTLAGWCHDQGHRVISDDVSVIRFDDAGLATVSPGLPRLRLWREALEQSGRHPRDFTPSYSGDPSYDKFDVPIGPDSRGGKPLPLAAIYLLSEDAVRAIEPIEGSAAVAALMANSYRGAYAGLAGRTPAQFSACVMLAGRVPLYDFKRPIGFDRLGEDSAALLDHAKRIGTEFNAGTSN